MSRKYELEVKVRGLFDGGKLSISLAEQFYDMDFGALAQALAYDAEPIYRFRIDNFHDDCGEYRSERLFRENGTLDAGKPQICGYFRSGGHGFHQSYLRNQPDCTDNGL